MFDYFKENKGKYTVDFCSSTKKKDNTHLFINKQNN